MSILLTEDQQHALEALREDVPQVVNPRTNEVFFLVPAEQFKRSRALLDVGPLTADERLAVLQGVWKRAGWDDPHFDAYESLVSQL